MTSYSIFRYLSSPPSTSGVSRSSSMEIHESYQNVVQEDVFRFQPIIDEDEYEDDDVTDIYGKKTSVSDIGGICRTTKIRRHFIGCNWRLRQLRPLKCFIFLVVRHFPLINAKACFYLELSEITGSMFSLNYSLKPIRIFGKCFLLTLFYTGYFMGAKHKITPPPPAALKSAKQVLLIWNLARMYFNMLTFETKQKKLKKGCHFADVSTFLHKFRQNLLKFACFCISNKYFPTTAFSFWFSVSESL